MFQLINPKSYVRQQFEKHRDENMHQYVGNKLTASQRRILTTIWIGNAWEKMKAITTAGSEDDHVLIEGYATHLPEEEFHLESSSDDEG